MVVLSMDKCIEKDYCIRIITEILYERGLINQTTFLEIKKRLQNDCLHILQENMA